MIIRLFLKIFAVALVFLMMADIFYELHLSTIASLIIQLGDEVLLLSFALLLISGGIFFAKQIIAAVTEYFSAKQRAQRRLFFFIARNHYMQRLFASKKQQLLYFSQLKKQILFAKDNKKQCALLAKAILKELLAIKPQLPVTQFEHYQQAIKQAAKHQQIQRLLELQQQISTTDLL